MLGGFCCIELMKPWRGQRKRGKGYDKFRGRCEERTGRQTESVHLNAPRNIRLSVVWMSSG